MGLGDLLKQSKEQEEKAEKEKEFQSKSLPIANKAAEPSAPKKELKKPNTKKNREVLKDNNSANEISFIGALEKNASAERVIDRVYVFKEHKEAIEKIAGMFNVKQIDVVTNIIDMFMEATKDERKALIKKRMQEMSDI
jgi:hypothetical protein